jgi:hypothetical protein
MLRERLRDGIWTDGTRGDLDVAAGIRDLA